MIKALGNDNYTINQYVGPLACVFDQATWLMSFFSVATLAAGIAIVIMWKNYAFEKYMF